jgi:hypothetical protein
MRGHCQIAAHDRKIGMAFFESAGRLQQVLNRDQFEPDGFAALGEIPRGRRQNCQVIAVARNRNPKHGRAFNINESRNGGRDACEASKSRSKDETAHLNLSASWKGLKMLNRGAGAKVPA